MGASEINAALIGCGRIAGHHSRALATVEGTNLIAVCDLEADKAQAHGREFGVPWYTNYRRMFAEQTAIDTVAVMTPSGMHAEQAMEMLERYGKDVIIEKPTFLRPEQLTLAYATADRLGLNIFPVFQNRYNLAVRRIKNAIEQGELGDIRVVAVRKRWCRPQRYYDMAPWRGTFSHDGGVLTNQGVHDVDLLRYLGGEIDKVNATMRTLDANIEVEDTVVATFTYSSGAVGTLEITTAARPDDFEGSISIVGSKGLTQIGGIAANQLQIFTPAPDDCAKFSEDFSNCVYGYGHEKLYRDLVAVRREGAPYPVNREDSLNTLKLLHAFYCSDENSDWVEARGDNQSVRLGRTNEDLANLYRTPEI